MKNFFSWASKYVFLWIFIAVVIFPIGWMTLNSFKTTREIQANPWSLPQELAARKAPLKTASTQLFDGIEALPDTMPQSAAEMREIAALLRSLTLEPVIERHGDQDFTILEAGGAIPTIKLYAPELRDAGTYVGRSDRVALNIENAADTLESGDLQRANSLRGRLDDDIVDLKEDFNELAGLASGKAKQGIFGNYAEAWTTTKIGKAFFNSLFVSALTMIILIPVAAMAAYVLSKYKFRGSNSIFMLFLGGMMFPQFLVIVPLFLQMAKLGLDDNLWGLTIVYIAFSLPFTVFVLTGFFHQLPDELIEASMLDGCSHGRAFWKIMLPLAKPGLVVVTIFDVIGLWNEYNLALAVLIVYWLLKEKIHEAMLAGAVKG
jgi:ABC-type glycerol-3-phosphate transport system permease component